jgi:leucyl aminopeptidase
MPIGCRLELAEGRLFPVAAEARVDSVAVPVASGADGPVLGSGGADLIDHTGLDLAAVLAGEDAKGSASETVAVPVPMADRVAQGVLVGVGDGSAPALRRAGAALARRASGRSSLATTVPSDASDDAFMAFAEGFLLASYEYTMATEPPPKPPVNLLTIVAGPSRRPTMDRAVAIADAVALARDLANTPSSVKSPEWLADQAVAMAGQAGLGVRIWTEDELRDQGFGGIIGVGMGSVRPPRLIQLTYAPEAPDRHMVLVGKGITFDSGGLSLKPNDNMKLMKTDMAGGAAVIGAMSALPRLGVRHRVTGLVAAAENLPSGSAQRPSDVITQYGGRTVEVLNTDAEGRLVLADAIAYACAHLAPHAIVDLATLTGAATVALGRTHGALYANDDTLATALLDAGSASGDRLWRMPLVDDYRDALDSTVADLANIAVREVSAGSIVAALFLREFVDGVPWAHLDIAGSARANSDEHELTKGATGFGVRALLRWLSDSGTATAS